MTAAIDTAAVFHGESDDVVVTIEITADGIRLAVARPESCWPSGEDVDADGYLTADEAARIGDQFHRFAELARGGGSS
ncbi:hypothetical protein ACQEVB_11720 [Pseudonocardia sp. CA-107938]|uniref:hypothetical protein n=1 Tax=Pseudonocardia sp. CA-107938 TaxID=3240021 RepID=UPI003D94D8FF